MEQDTSDICPLCRQHIDTGSRPEFNIASMTRHVAHEIASDPELAQAFLHNAPDLRQRIRRQTVPALADSMRAINV